ncbi:auxin-responsive protein SAUR67-like [Chenopodium quinoa]|uniref:Uncharacterized protein n=1 Tax=Chenopodium quinoa TaxID=63459 RepID=A0A803LG69_CHEQI|nr:auxin-responsive protein SAUR67-like [Chenopodium quinoa]
MARKWQKLAAASRKRISWPASKVADKGHFIVYTIDGERFMIPLSFLKSDFVTQLFQMAEEEFGLSDGHITLPCDSTFMKYAISILQRHTAKDFEKALILSLSNTCHSTSLSCLQQQQNSQHLLIHSF